MAKRMRVVTGDEKPSVKIVASDNPKVNNQLTANEFQARVNAKYATTTTMGALGMRRSAGDVMDSGGGSFYSPQLSTDFLEKPQNLRERRAFYRFFYNTNEMVGRAVDIHSELPMSKLRLVPPKAKNRHQAAYVQKFFEDMCERMKLFGTLIEISHEFYLMGNCLCKYAEVGIPGGFKRADQINVGDLVLTHMGRYRRVLKTCVRPSDKILNIKCWKDFRCIPVTEEHPIEILRGGEFLFEQAENISVKDYIRVSYPTEIEDTNNINFEIPEKFRKTETGYEYTVEIPHLRSPIAIDIRKKLLSWLGSLTEPTIRTREDIANDFKVSQVNLNGIILNLDNELEEPFHKRIGAVGYQKGSQVIWYPIKDIPEVTDSYTMYRNQSFNAIASIKIDNDFAYLAGFWLGDGTLGRDNNRNIWGRGLWQICFSENEIENISRIENILIKIFGKDAIVKWSCNTIVFIKVISNPIFIEWWANNFGETSFGTNNKRIPEWFKKLPIEKLKYFLAGLIDSDGCVSVSGPKRHCVVSATMASRSIMDSVRDIALKCGIVISYNEIDEREVILPNGNKDTSRKMYSIIASDEESCLIFAEYSNKVIPEDAHFSNMDKYWQRTDNGLAFRVRGITEEDYNDLVYNFEVEEDHTYQVAGFSTHNCFIFCENNDISGSPEEMSRIKEESRQKSEFLKQKYDIKDINPAYKGWGKLIILPPDQVRVRKLPLTDAVAIEYMPDPETRKFLTSDIPIDPSDPSKGIKSDVSDELREKVRQSGTIPMDTDPYSGSHVYHLARKKSQYEPLGISILERCVNTLVYMDKLRQAQTSIASRHMTPMRIVWAEGLSNDQVDNLREQVDLALIDPDFSIIANYEVHWEEMGSQGRILDLEGEYTGCTDRLLAGLGMTREILTGEGSYSGSRISLEIMNTQYLLFRERIQEYVENYLFKPVARKKGFIEYDDYGNEVLIYPKLSFTRLSIRDNETYFDAAFQLYQKGSVSIDLILDILNIDSDSTREKIEKDLLTVNDSMFNEVMRNLYTSAATALVEKTDVTQKLADYLKLKMTEETPPPEGTARFSSEAGTLDKDHAIKLAKLMTYMKNNPAALDKMFTNGANNAKTNK